MTRLTYLNGILIVFCVSTIMVIAFQAYHTGVTCFLEQPEHSTTELSKFQVETFQQYNDVETYLVVVGYQNNDLDLISSILDAHPNMIVSNDYESGNKKPMNGFKITVTQIKKYALYQEAHSSSLKRAMFYAQDPKSFGWAVDREGGFYIPDTWQGTYKDRIKVVGSTIPTDPLKSKKILNSFEEVAGVPLKVIHVLGNPYDDIATIARAISRSKSQQKLQDARTVQNASKSYFQVLSTKLNALQKYGARVLIVKRDEIINQPKQTIQKMCDHMKVACDQDYTKACLKVLPAKLPATRDEVQWDQETQKTVQENLRRYSFFKEYAQMNLIQ